MTPCPDQDLAISLHAAGALEPAEAARLEQHLDGCAACRAALVGAAEALRLARLPAPTEAERAALADLPSRTLSALQRSDRRRLAGRRFLVGALAAAAAALVVLAPAILRRTPQVPATQQTAQAAEWQAPDIDTLWSDTSVLDLESATYVTGTAYDAGSDTADTSGGDDTLSALDF